MKILKSLMTLGLGATILVGSAAVGLADNNASKQTPDAGQTKTKQTMHKHRKHRRHRKHKAMKATSKAHASKSLPDQAPTKKAKHRHRHSRKAKTSKQTETGKTK